MAAARPLVSVFDATSGKSTGSVELPGVFHAPIRRDIVETVHMGVARNRRQAYSVSKFAGEQTSAESWGTGRAVARIPRVAGSGTHRSGQAAFGNMCRKGRMWAPTKTWRRWHRAVPVNQRRYAVASAVAASGLVPLVMARGHKIDELEEVPLVLDNLAGIAKTSEAAKALARVGAFDDVQASKDSKKVRVGKGKARNRRFVMKRGPLVILSTADGAAVARSFRNLAGVDLCRVDALNVLKLAPGGHLGRLCVWSKAAFEELNGLFGSPTEASSGKTRRGAAYHLPSPLMANADLGEILQAPAILAKVRAPKGAIPSFRRQGNPLKNKAIMDELNPYAAEVRATKSTAKPKSETTKYSKERRAASKAFFKRLTSDEWLGGQH